MISRYKVWLNGESLEEISPLIYISDISYGGAAPAYAANRIGKNDGQLSGADYIDGATVTVSFEAREYSTQKRQRIVNDVAAWAAKGGWLNTSDRDGQRLYVRCTQFPAVNSVRNWLDTLAVEFTAFEVPYWTAVDPVSVTVANGGSGTLRLGGARKTYCEAVITAGAALTSLSVTVGSTTIALTGLSVANGDTVTISYTDDHHILEIKHGTTSILNKRTAASSDDLVAEVGDNAVSFTASGTASCTVKAREVYL